MSVIKTKTVDRQGQREASILKVSCLYDKLLFIFGHIYTLYLLVELLDSQEKCRVVSQ